MAWIKIAFLTTAFLATTLSQAAPKPSNDGAQNNAKAPAHPPYGENPNIFKVFAYKTQEKVINTADKVGEATENGISKIKPKVDQAWDTVTSAPNGVVPIESKPLSQSSNAPNPKPVMPTSQTPDTTSSAPISPQSPSTIKSPTTSKFQTSPPSKSPQIGTVDPTMSVSSQSHISGDTAPQSEPAVASPQTPAQSTAPADARPASQPISNTEPDAEPLPQLAPLKPAQAEAPASDKAQSGVFYL